MSWYRAVSLAAVWALAVTGTAAAQAPQLRMKWQDFVAGPDGAKRLTSLENAIKKMKSLDTSPPTSPDYRRSWQYWANIHGYYGPTSPDGTVAQQIQYLQQNGMGKYVPYYQGITDQTAPDQVAKTVWATCQHSGGPGQQALNFFGWHRMYLYYFERVLRWAAQDDTLRLPYWDYTDPAQLALPAEFRQTAAVVYDAKRNPGMNAGTSSLRSSATNVDALLKGTDYFKYESGIEEGVHGYVHCTVGPTCPVAHMGDVPLAGNDPVFYHHHANIDRLWACWQGLHGTPKGAWQQQQFSFVDETGTMQTKPVSFVVDPSALGYAYDNATSCSRPSTTVAAAPRPPRGERGRSCTSRRPCRSRSRRPSSTSTSRRRRSPRPWATSTARRPSSWCCATSPRPATRACCSTSSWRRRARPTCASTWARSPGSARSGTTARAGP